MSFSTQCIRCKHFDFHTWKCLAFPDGAIPPDILEGNCEHTVPHPGDHGIQFEARRDDPGPPTNSDNLQLESLAVVKHTERPCILVVEDEPDHQRLMQIMLAKLDYDSVITASGKDALKRILNEDFDVILMDMRIPDIDGFLLTTILRGHGVKTPIVATTALTLEGLDKRALDAGFDDYLSKPIDKNVLAEVLKKYLAIPLVGNARYGGRIHRMKISREETCSQ